MSFEAFFAHHQDELVDFWGRRENTPRYLREFRLIGRTVRLTSNDQAVLAAADWSQPLFSNAPTRLRQPYVCQLVVRPAPVDPGPVPEDLIRYIQYTGHDDWLAIQYGAWGHCQVNLSAGRAVAVLTPQLAERPDLISSWLLNTVLTNFLLADHLGMLHATGLVRNNHAVLLIAPHNHGKSTTALRLTLAGYHFVSDSQIYIMPAEGAAAGGRIFERSPGGEGRFELAGFPVGRVKLRSDMIARFPEFEPLLRAEQIRAETKFVLDLRQLNPLRVHEEIFSPDKIDLCLLQRHHHQQTTFGPATRPEVMAAVMHNSLFYDDALIWQRNLTMIEQLVARARLHHLTVGVDPDGVVAAVDQLVEQD